MTPLRKRMIRELKLQRKSPKTVQAYVAAVAHLAAHYGRSPLDESIKRFSLSVTIRHAASDTNTGSHGTTLFP